MMGRISWPPAMRGVLTLSLGTIIGHCVIVAGAPLLTRLYGPVEFGALAVFTSALTLLLVPSALRYDVSIMVPADDATAATLLVVSLTSVAGTGVLSATVIALLPVFRIGTPLKGLEWLLPLSVMGGGCYQALSYWALRHRRYSQLAVTKATQSTFLTVTQLVAGLLGAGALGLALGDAVGRMTGTISLARFAWSSARGEFRVVTLRSLWGNAKRFGSFPLFSCPSALINTAASQVPVLLFAALYGKQVAGHYMLLDRTLAGFSALISQNILQVYSADLSRTLATAPQDAYRLFLRYARNMCLPGIAFGSCLALLGPAVFGAVFGSAWRESGYYARSFALAQGVALMVWPMMLTLTIMQKQRLQLAWDVGRSILTIGSVLLSVQMHASARGAIFAYALALSIAYILYFLLARDALKSADQSPNLALESAMSSPA